MKKYFLFLGCLLFVVLTGFLSCSKDDEGEFLVSNTNIVGVWYQQSTNPSHRSIILDIGSNGMVTLRSGYLNIDGYIEVSKSSKSQLNDGPFLINPDGTFDGTYRGEKAQFEIKLFRHGYSLDLVVMTENNGKTNTFRISDFGKAKGIKWVE